MSKLRASRIRPGRRTGCRRTRCRTSARQPLHQLPDDLLHELAGPAEHLRVHQVLGPQHRLEQRGLGSMRASTAGSVTTSWISYRSIASRSQPFDGLLGEQPGDVVEPVDGGQRRRPVPRRAVRRAGADPRRGRRASPAPRPGRPPARRARLPAEAGAARLRRAAAATAREWDRLMSVLPGASAASTRSSSCARRRPPAPAPRPAASGPVRSRAAPARRSSQPAWAMRLPLARAGRSRKPGAARAGPPGSRARVIPADQLVEHVQHARSVSQHLLAGEREQPGQPVAEPIAGTDAPRTARAGSAAAVPRSDQPRARTPRPAGRAAPPRSAATRSGDAERRGPVQAERGAGVPERVADARPWRRPPRSAGAGPPRTPSTSHSARWVRGLRRRVPSSGAAGGARTGRSCRHSASATVERPAQRPRSRRRRRRPREVVQHSLRPVRRCRTARRRTARRPAGPGRAPAVDPLVEYGGRGRPASVGAVRAGLDQRGQPVVGLRSASTVSISSASTAGRGPELRDHAGDREHPQPVQHLAARQVRRRQVRGRPPAAVEPRPAPARRDRRGPAAAAGCRGCRRPTRSPLSAATISTTTGWLPGAQRAAASSTAAAGSSASLTSAPTRPSSTSTRAGCGWPRSRARPSRDASGRRSGRRWRPAAAGRAAGPSPSR